MKRERRRVQSATDLGVCVLQYFPLVLCLFLLSLCALEISGAALSLALYSASAYSGLCTVLVGAAALKQAQSLSFLLSLSLSLRCCCGIAFGSASSTPRRSSACGLCARAVCNAAHHSCVPRVQRAAPRGLPPLWGQADGARPLPQPLPRPPEPHRPPAPRGTWGK